MTPDEPFSLSDFEALAARGLEARRAAYLFGGAADGLTLSANRKALDEIRLLPRVLADLSQASARVSLFGDVYRAPVFVAPMGYQKLFHETGESGLAQAAAAMGAGFVLSTQASCPIETVAEAGEGAPQWFQLYFQPERDATLRLVRRAEAAGYRAIVVTVDAPVSGVRNHEMRAGFRLPPDVAAVNLAGARHAPPPEPDGFLGGLLDHAPGWPDLEWLRRETRLPLVIKGVLHPADARRAREAGSDGLIVSNHGGRTLDTAVPAIAMLPHIREAVGNVLPVLVDGGIRRGTDVFKALALGADAVLVGRPLAAALAVGGPRGAARALRILMDEFEVAMALCGCAHPSAITSEWLLPKEPSMSGAERVAPAGWSAR